MAFIQRDFERTEHDDWVLNVQPRLGEQDGATPIYSTNQETLGEVVGWIIKPLYE